MSQTRLNNIAVLNCHRSYVEAVDIDNILDEFISKCTVRQNTFAMKSEISHSMRNTAQAAQHLEMQCSVTLYPELYYVLQRIKPSILYYSGLFVYAV
jgi:hypothetical protein